MCETIIIIKEDTLLNQIENILVRTINRSKGTEPQGACYETPKSAAYLLIKSIKGYDENVNGLKNFKTYCDTTNCSIIYDLRDNLCELYFLN